MALFFLTGMPAAGKTYWGKHIADNLSLRFIDLDAYIESQEGATLPEIFENFGESGFREIEHALLDHLIQSAEGDTVIACGGGTPCFHNNMSMIKQSGKVIYLDVPVQELAGNLAKSPTQRPLLHKTKDVATQLKDMLQHRKHVYEQAHYILPAENISLTTFAEIISQCTNRQ